MNMLKTCEAHHFRNLAPQTIELSSGINLFVGENGSGKTSIIEALHHLSVARSFRTHLTRDVIAHDDHELVVRGVFKDGNSRALQKTTDNKTELRVNDEKVSLVTFARSYPAVLVYQTIYQLIDSGAKLRRNLLDWGLFHVKHDYLQQLKAYNQVLKRRNALLKQQSSREQLDYWDNTLVESGLSLHVARQAYLETLLPVFYEILTSLGGFSIKVQYQSGWKNAQTVPACLSLLKESQARDLRFGVTHVGAHKADLIFDAADKKAKAVLSRGQQKLALMAFKLAQSHFLNAPHLYLIDDLCAELDNQHLNRILSYLASLSTNNQAVITALEKKPLLLDYVTSMFHVKHGAIKKEMIIV